MSVSETTQPPASKTAPPQADLARQAAFDVLVVAEENRRRRNLKLDELMNRFRGHYTERYGSQWGRQEQTLFHALCTGTVRHWWQLEGLLVHFLQRDLRRVTPQVRAILRLGLFQLMFLSEIPEYAAVHATVQVAQQRKLSKKTVGLINAVLRNYGRQKAANELPAKDLTSDPYGYFISEGALPNWLARHLLDHYPANELAELCKAQQTPVPISLRANTLKATATHVQQQFLAAGITCHAVTGLPEMLILDGFVGSPNQLPGFAEGHIYVQDISSARVAPFLDMKPGQTVIDLCAAPGSKTTHLAALMENTGSIIALDRKPKRLAVLEENCQRLGVTNVMAKEADSATVSLQDLGLTEPADAVLVDAPCSGLGTLRKHPEILLNLREKDMEAFPPKQLALLANAAKLVKPGGTVVYSTCSISPTENQAVTQAFLACHPDFNLREENTYLTYADGTTHWDGFYMAKLTLKK